MIALDEIEKETEMTKKKLAILLFNDIEVLDFAGPFEVFSITNELNDFKLLDVYTVAPIKAPIFTNNELSVNPDYSISKAPKPDLLIVPGGYGVRAMLQQHDVIDWIQKKSIAAEKVMSVCTGAFLLAKAGLLEGLKATTHYQAFDLLAKLAPNTEIVKNDRFVDNGKVLTSAGVSAGIDMSLHVVTLLYGKEEAKRTANYIEYETI
jgi:transcriptional regulator GlxA family with amidase domain